MSGPTYDLGEDAAFTVRGRIVGHGEETLPDGTTRRYAKAKVTSIEASPGVSQLRVTISPDEDHDDG